MSHRRAVLLMIVVTLMWSTAGVVSRHLEAARSFEVTFWRSAFNALSLLVALRFLRGPSFWVQLRAAPRAVWMSGLCWSVMFTAFMLAITMTTVANVLVTMALGPLLTALFSRIFLQHRLPGRTWAAIGLGSAGIAWMFGSEMQGGWQALAGMLVALGVPLAAATNWTVIQAVARREPAAQGDMLIAVFIGAVISAALTLPLSLPWAASAHDLTLLAGLGLGQLALPCLLVVHLARILPAPEIALLALLEVIFGVLWAWLWGGETPGAAALSGGALVLLALLGNELLGWRRHAAAETGSSSN